MSKEIDQKVVEMRFDNKHFESNVQTTMSSIKKLEDSLKFKDATKGFDNLDRSSKKVDMTHLGKGLDMVQAKFSAMQVIGTTALVNITNSAINAGKKIISALTIDPVKTGFQEYETQMNAVQTILANTASKGSTLKDVNAALDELNTYADKTIYNFTEMTRNIGTFTAAGIDLETSVNSIQGIANLAAVSGSTSQQASTAMYQLSQALAAGTVKLMDWNSVVNAGMGGEMFQNALKETSKELNTGAEAAIKAEGSFRESLKTGWLTSEVLTETLKKFTTSGANEYVAKYTGLSAEAVEAALKEAEARYGEADAIEKASEALAKKSGKNKDEIKSVLQFAKNAEDAATKVKTFSQLWDVMKEAAQSGWAQTWRLIIGDFEEAKSLLTPLADFFTKIIGKMSDARNKLLERALGKTFTDLSKKIKGITKPVKDASDAVKNVTDTVKNYGEVVNKVINGDFGNGESRFKALTKAGYDYAHVQNLVNEKLGSSVRHTTKYKDAQEKLNDSQDDANVTQKELSETEAERLEQLSKMSDAELKALGYSDKQIKAFRDLKKEADKLGMSVKDFIKNIDKLDGRTILINSFKNIGEGIVKTFKAIGEAWKNVFPPATSEQLYNVIAGFHKLSTNFKMNEETATQLRQTFEGLFTILRIAMTLVGGPLSIAFKLVCKILKTFDLNILDVTSRIGNAIVKFDKWLESTLNFSDALDKLTEFFKRVLEPFEKVKEAWNELFPKETEDNIGSASDKLTELKDSLNISDNAADNFKKVCEGLEAVLKGLSWTISVSLTTGLKLLKAVLGLFDLTIMDVLANIGNYISIARKWLDEHVAIANTIDEVAQVLSVLITGIKECVKAFFALEPVKKAIENIKNAFVELFGTVGGGIESINIGSFVKKISDGFTKIKEWINSLKDSENIGWDLVRGLANGITNGLGYVIGKVANLVTTIISTVCSLFGINSPSKVFFLIGTFLIAGLVSGLEVNMDSVKKTIVKLCSSAIEGATGLINSFCEYIKNIDFEKIIGLGISVGVLLLFKKFIDAIEMFSNPFDKLGGMFKSIGGYFDELKKSAKRSNVAKMVLQLAISVGILALSAKILADVPVKDLIKSGVAIVALCAVVLGLAAATKLIAGVEGTLAKLAVGLIAMGVAIGIIAWSMRSLQFLTNENVGPIIYALEEIGAILIILSAISKIPTDSKGLFGTLVGVSIALFVMVKIVKMVSGMTDDELERAIIWIGGFSGILAALILVAKIGNSTIGLGPMFWGIGATLLAMIAVAKIAGSMTDDEWLKGIGAIAAFTIFIIGLMAVSSASAKFSEGNAIKLAGTLFGISLALLAMAVAAKIAGSMTDDEWIKGIGAVAAFTVFMYALILVANLTPPNVGKLTGTLTGIAICLTMMAVIATLLGYIPIDKLIKGGVAVAALGAILAVMMWTAQFVKGGMKDILAMTAAISILVGALVALSFIPNLDPAVEALTKVSIIFMLMGAVFSHTDISVKDVLTMSAVLIVLAGALWLIAGLPIANALVGAAALSVLMISLTACMYAIQGIQNVSIDALAALGVMTLALGVLAGALWLIAGLPIANALVGAAALSVLMLSLSVSMMIISNVGAGAIAGAAALIIIAGALAILTPCLQALGSMSLAQIGIGLLGLAGAFAVIGVAGLLLGPITPMIIALGIGIAAVGVGCMAAGVGLMTFSLGLQTLIAMGPAGAAAITLLVTTILTLIPMIAVALANGIIQFATTIAAGAVTLAAAVVTVVNAIISALVGTIPNILSAANTLLTAFLNFITSSIPKMVNAGMKLIKGILQGIANNIGGVVKAATDIILNFLNAISQNLPRVIDAGVKLIISFINGMADAIRGNTGPMISAVNNLMSAMISAIGKWFGNIFSKAAQLGGKLVSGAKKGGAGLKDAAGDMINGFIKGVSAKFKAVKDAAVNVVKGAVDAVKSFLGINSPSKVFAKIGRYTDEGFALGLNKYSKLGSNAAKNIGEGALQGLKDVLGVNSPATEGIDIGAFLTEGFAIGIEKLKGVVEKAGTNVGSIASKAIGEGIKKDMAAEEQAEKKATNITNAFKKKFNEIDNEEKLFDLKLELGQISDIEHFEESIKLQGDRVANAWAEYQTKLSTLGENSEYTKAAYTAYYQELVDLKKIAKERSDTLEQIRTDNIDLKYDNADLEYEAGIIDYNERFAKQLKIQADKTNEAFNKYSETLKSFPKDSKEVNEAYNKWLNEYIKLDTLQNDRKEKLIEDRENQLDRTESINELEYEIWSKLNEDTASESKKAAANLSMLTGQYNVDLERLNSAQQKYNDYLNDVNRTAEEIENARIDVLNAQNAFIDSKKNLATAQEEEEKRQKNALMKYTKYLNENRKALLEFGITNEEIERAAQKYSGYDPSVKVDLTKPAEAATALVSAFGEKLQNGDSEGLNTAVQTMVTTCSDKIKENRPSWVEGAKYLVDGFIQGINDNVESAALAAANMAKAAYRAAMDALEINSPSKAFADLGRFVDLGFAQGITKYAKFVNNATTGLGESVIDSMLDPVSRIADIVNGDMSSTPTIRPVLSLSSANNAARQIDGMFGRTTFELANINAGMVRTDMDNLSSMVSRLEALNESGNMDIVNAISNLRGDFGSLVKAIGSMHIRMDSGTVVGELIGKIDGQLGQIANHKGRGN